VTLEIGNVERIDDPSAQQVDHYLRFMPPHAPFIILTAGENFFMQAAAAENGYRVEYREGKRQFSAKVSLEQASALLDAFRQGDDQFRKLTAWHRLGVLNDPHSSVPVVIVLLLLILLVGLQVWNLLRAF
jgi:hypothetical protein